MNKNDKNINQMYGLTLKKIRFQKELSQEELAFRAGLDRTYISSLERGKRNPSLVTMDKIARALDVKLSVFFD
ncbi:helix-turn-helix transcriptional regulator [Halobacillus sp. KCTC 3957]|uniref:Helix-turn-helix transcriptional regulator n=2 Tax=Halobacillus yeomjeoni TaxID=311194 RepID=A0A931HXS1_9BACI|nr:helix-turn-helix transcriptional regulator [Halobacillus yeomjeoni]